MAGNKYTPSSQVRKRISDWEGAAMHGSTIDPLSKKKVAKNNSIDNEASLFASKIPEEIREKVFSNQELADNLFSYSYNVGSHNFKKRVVPTLMNYYSGKASARDVADTMSASGDSKLRGLQKRRNYEKSHVVSALQKNNPIYRAQLPVTPIFTSDALRVDAPYPTYVESATPVPVMVPDENSFVTAHPQTPEERSAMQFNQRMENIQRLNRLFDIADIKNIEIPQYTSRNNPYVISSYSEGGKLKKKSWDDLSMEEKSEMIGVAVRQGYTNISDIRDKYNEFAEGGNTEESHLSYGYPVYWSDEVPSKYNWAKSYLKEHPDVTGFAVGGGAQGPEDIGQRVIIRNSHSNIIPDHNDSRWYGLDKIEAIRHYMEETGYTPNFETSPEQDKFRRDNFSNEDQYGRNDTAWKQSVISRITADKETDKEFGVTPEQFRDYANIMRGLNSKMDNHYNIPSEYRGGYYLPEVTISGKKYSIGGPFVESVMNEYSNGGPIHIKPSHRGRLTELKKRTGKTEAELYRTGSPATRKMITFARNARKWKHGEGGPLVEEVNMYEGGGIKETFLKAGLWLADKLGISDEYKGIDKDTHYRKNLYNAIDPNAGYPSNIAEVLDYKRIADNAKKPNVRYRKVREVNDPVADAAWAKRLGIAYNDSYLPSNDDGSVKLPQYLEEEIPTDTIFLKDRITANKKLRDRYRRAGGLSSNRREVLDAAIDVDQETLNSLRHTYNTGEPVVINEHSYINRNWINNGIAKLTPSPLSLLQNYTIRYNKDTGRMEYSDTYDFNQFENFVPGKPFNIKGSVSTKRRQGIR